MATYKLYYFNARGRAEVLRLLFAAAGQRFEDSRFEQNTWPSFKSQMPLSQVPVLEVNGTTLVQSQTIARFLARQFLLGGRDGFELAKVEAVVDTINDFVSILSPIRREQDEKKKKEQLQKFLNDDLPKHLQNLEILARLYGNGGQYFIGNNLTLADLTFYDAGETLLQLDPNCLNNHPWLKQNRLLVASQPRIAEYLRNRPKTAF
ncbi:unnamed protein product [Adineta steineri]|uniref:glutathione transferase n=1 Tax=Adineta steineri TaxID=433720 RepID=A0A814T0K3_9BILA|nr:unnamed protein product [Adineta steineri]CAF1155102.1 unnamed protein product [Adineta steineri]CAF1342161.1 unnamed protein product [Adineta steineri]CAF4120509.1 unnamed protein product [Adineta steineri]